MTWYLMANALSSEYIYKKDEQKGELSLMN